MESICNSKTSLYCILGNPVSHCNSPIIHNLAFHKTGINSVFLSFVCDHGNIRQVFESIRTLGIKGGSITMPVKLDAMQYMDSIADDARLIGSINVFKNENGVLTGYNTDGLGVVRFLQHKKISFQTKAVVAGAGGAGQSIAIQMALHGTKTLVICDKNLSAAQALGEKINKNIPSCKASWISSEESAIIRELQDSSILVDATPLGLHPLEGKSLLTSVEGIPKDVVFFDVCYAPPKTKLLQIAEQGGHPIYNGIGMLIHQGAAAFHIWTGQEFPLEYVQENLPLYDTNR